MTSNLTGKTPLKGHNEKWEILEVAPTKMLKQK